MTVKEHYHLIDGIRGLALLNMLLFHFSYDYFMVFARDRSWYFKPWSHAWQQGICLTFLFLSGVAWHFGHNNLKKGLLLNLYGLVITAVTYVFLPSETVWFGILNGIGCATLLLCLLDRLGRRIASPAGNLCGLILSFLLFLLLRDVSEGYLGFGSFHVLALPSWLYRPKFMTILGFPFPGFVSSDYFPILPWSLVPICGYWFWKLIRPYEKCLAFFRIRIPLLSPLGRRTIWIYMLHQPVLYGLAYILVRAGL